MQESKSFLKAKRLKERLGKQDFHYDMEEVFEPVIVKQAEATENQKQLSERKLQALRNSSQTTTEAIDQQSQGFVQAIQDQTRAIRESSKAMNKKLQKSVEKGIQEYDEITNRNIQLVTNLDNSNQVHSSLVKTVSNLLNTQSQFKLQPVEGNPNLFIINPTILKKY